MVFGGEECNVTQCYVVWAGKSLITKECYIVPILGKLRESARECVGKVTIVLCNEIFYK